VIDDEAFRGCTGLKKVNLCDGHERIGYGAFMRCTSLKSIKIPSTVFGIGEQAFEGCNGLRRLKIGEGLKTIGFQVFLNCSSLEHINIPSTLESVGRGAFEDYFVLNRDRASAHSSRLCAMRQASMQRTHPITT